MRKRSQEDTWRICRNWGTPVSDEPILIWVTTGIPWTHSLLFWSLIGTTIHFIGQVILTHIPGKNDGDFAVTCGAWNSTRSTSRKGDLTNSKVLSGSPSNRCLIAAGYIRANTRISPQFYGLTYYIILHIFIRACYTPIDMIPAGDLKPVSRGFPGQSAWWGSSSVAEAKFT